MPHKIKPHNPYKKLPPDDESSGSFYKLQLNAVRTVWILLTEDDGCYYAI